MCATSNITFKNKFYRRTLSRELHDAISSEEEISLTRAVRLPCGTWTDGAVKEGQMLYMRDLMS